MDDLAIKKYLLKGGAWAIAGKLLLALMGLVMSAILARLLSPDEMGVFFLAFNLATFFAIFSRFGLENTLLRFISEALVLQDYKRVHEAINKGILLVVLISTIVCLAFYLFLGEWIADTLFSSESLKFVVGFVALWSALLTFQFLLGEIFRGFQNIRESIIFGGLLTAIVTVVFFSIILVTTQATTLCGVLSWILVAAGINMFFGFVFLRRQINDISRQDDDVSKTTYNELLHHAWPLMLNAILLFALTQSALWILAAFRPEGEVAIYGTAARLVILTNMALQVVNAIIPPLIAKFNVTDQKEKLEKILRTTATMAAVPAIAVLFVFIVFGGHVLAIVFGDYYRQGAFVLMILSISQGVNVLVGSCGYVLIMTGHRKTMMIITMISTLFGVSFGLLSVEQYGSVGVAVANSVAVILQQVLMLTFARYWCGIWTHASFRYLSEIKKTFLRSAV